MKTAFFFGETEKLKGTDDKFSAILQLDHVAAHVAQINLLF